MAQFLSYANLSASWLRTASAPVEGRPNGIFAEAEAVIKKQPKALRAKSTCDMVKADGELNVYVKQASGQMAPPTSPG